MLCTRWSQLVAWIEREPAPTPHPSRSRARGCAAQPPRARAWYKPSSPMAAEHTLRYLFFRQRCGIYVKVRRNAVFCFIPFANPRYENDWPQKPWMDACKSDANLPPHRWWCNGHVLCNQQPRHVWGLHFVKEMRDMLESVCTAYHVDDIDFCLNKRDYPQLRQDGQDPAPYAAPGPPLSENFGPHHIPILSFYSHPHTWADILWPLPEDWTLAQEQPAACARPWRRKKDAAVFRGSATGRGVTPATNARLRLAQMRDVDKGLDVGIVSWNERWKCSAPGQAPQMPDIDRLKREGIQLVPRLDMAQQREFRYVLYVAGHCAANRYSALMRQGSVILRVEDPPGTPGHLWFFHHLEPWQDHVPVKCDLSDLEEKLQWCREHPSECADMVARCRRLVRTVLSAKGILRHAACTLAQLPRAPSSRNSSTGDAGDASRAHLQRTPITSEYPPPKRHRN